MKKILVLLMLSTLNFVNGQGYIELNKLLHRLEQENKINHETELHYDLEGKRFIYLKDFPEKTERRILEIRNNASQLIELEDDKSTGKTTSKIYTGDVVRKNHVVSIRLDKLEGERIGMPVTFLYHLTYQGGIWYLLDANTGLRWIDTQDLNKKVQILDKKEIRKQKRKNKNRE